jgi:hypothetical protein
VPARPRTAGAFPGPSPVLPGGFRGHCVETIGCTETRQRRRFLRSDFWSIRGRSPLAPALLPSLSQMPMASPSCPSPDVRASATRLAVGNSPT